MKRFTLTPAAQDDLIDISDFIAANNPDAARRLLRELRDAIRRLAAMPLLGHVREDLADEPLRFWPVRRYLIVYRSDPRPIQILRVLHGSRDIRTLLDVSQR